MTRQVSVLIIDDDDIDRLSYKRILDKNLQIQPTYHEASTGAEALNKITLKIPDLILLDYHLPDLNGLVLLDKISTTIHRKIPTVMMTAQGDESIAVEAIKKGASDYLVKMDVTTERLIHVFNKALETLDLEIKIENQRKEYEHLAHHDNLTGLLNRFSFEKFFSSVLSHSERIKSNLALLFLDLDNFKMINDTYGHQVGDELIKSVGQTIQHCLRQEDLFARIGGDEFAICLYDLKRSSSAQKVAKKIIQSVNKPFSIKDRNIYVGVSIGIVTSPETIATTEEFMKYADIAMYRAKSKGGNRYQFFSDRLNDEFQERSFIEEGLRNAINNNELFMVYQPQICINTSKIIGVEGLIRWQHPSLGLVPPDKMIPIAEDSGQISMIDSWVIESACNEYKYLIEKHDAKFQLSLNLSQKNIPNDEIHRAIKKATEDNNFNLSRIDLEITETAMNTSDKEIIYVLDKLRKMNLHISVDDFGTGFATFTQLKNYLPVHSIKIDKSFVTNIHKSKNDAMIVKSIIELARNLDVAVIAEGVEEKSQLNLLREFNCNAVQGFYLGKPMRVSELNSFLSRHH